MRLSRLGLLRSPSPTALAAAVASVLGAAAWAIAGHALAADGAPAQAGTVAEVVVTAARREQSLQKIPTSVAAIGADKLERAGIQNFYDVANVTPSLNITEVGNNRFINIRGVGIAVSTPFQTAGVPLHVDGMYITNSAAFARDPFFDVERVEVYRGPQGTFAGQNSTGGAIFITSKKPQFDQFGGQIQQLVGNYAWLQTQGAVNLPITHTLAARLAFDYETRDSFFTNLGPQGPGVGNTPGYVNSNRPGSVSRQMVRGILRWQPTDRFEAQFKAEYSRAWDDGPVALRAAPGSFNNPAQLINPWTISYDFPQYNKVDLYRGTLNLRYHLTDGIDIKTVSGGQYIRSYIGGDTDATSPFVADPYAATTQYLNQTDATFRNSDNYWFQELDLVSTSAGRLHWVAGVTGFTQITNLYNDAQGYNVNNCASPANPVCTTPNITNSGTWLDYFQKGRSWAAFGEVTYNFNDHFQAIAGGRWTYYKIDLRPGSTVKSAVPPHPLLLCGPVGNQSGCNVSGSGKYDRFTGRVALNWFPNADTTVYVTYNQGMKPGSFFSQFTLNQNPALGTTTPSQYKSETLRNYEGGVKALLFGRRLRTNISGFYDDYRDYQASFAIPGTVIPRSVNIPKSRTYGVELESQAVFGDFRVDLTGAWLNTRILTGLPAGVTGLNVSSGYYGVAGGISCPSAAPGPNQNLFPCAKTPTVPLPTGVNLISGTGQFDPTGEPLNFSPSWTLNGALEYDIHLRSGVLTPRFQYSYIGEQWASLYHASQDYLPAHHQIDLRLTYSAQEHWRVEGFVTNVTDELYISGVTPAAPTVANPAPGTVSLGAPRQFGMRVQYTY